MTPQLFMTVPRWPAAFARDPKFLPALWHHLGERAGPDGYLWSEREVREARRLASQSELQRLTR
ncbi:hypothetical protein DEDE109153_13025 [Deinococcus deserti]|uniref:hypothetical protein n=1 Tax=Deinococcus deserti TaxID=310783 RepID=UPI00059CF192|nr:hypothetical protein [Deinococcus deserti]